MIGWVNQLARKGRIKSSTGIYHAVLRGQKNLFFDSNDYLEFIGVLKRYFQNTDSQLYAYSLEKNKVHLVFYTPGDISDVMKPLCTSYARYVNRTHNKNGKLFYDRYMSEPIEDTDILEKAICFVNEHKKALHTSKDEYMNKAELCAVDALEKKSVKNIKNPSVIYVFIDDYASMSDSELKSYLLSTGEQDKEKLLEYALEYSNLSRARVSRILNLTKAKKATPKPKPQPKEEEPARYKKQELSVWLL